MDIRAMAIDGQAARSGGAQGIARTAAHGATSAEVTGGEVTSAEAAKRAGSWALGAGERGALSAGLWLEWLVGAALALWTGYEVLTFHSQLLAGWELLPYAQFVVRSLVFAALIAAIACRDVAGDLRSRVILFVGLVAALLFRARAGGDNRLIILVLFLMAVQGMDYWRVALAYACGAFVALVGLAFLVLRAGMAGPDPVGMLTTVGSSGMEHVKSAGCLLLGASAALVSGACSRSRRVAGATDGDHLASCPHDGARHASDANAGAGHAASVTDGARHAAEASSEARHAAGVTGGAKHTADTNGAAQHAAGTNAEGRDAHASWRWIVACMVCVICGVVSLAIWGLPLCGGIELVLAAGVAFSGLAPELDRRVAGSRAVRVAVAAIPIALCALALITCAFYDAGNPLLAGLDRLMGGGLARAHEAFAYAGPYVAVGSTNDRLGELAAQGQFVFFDGACAYVFWAINYGLIFMAFLGVLYVLTVFAMPDAAASISLWLVFVLIAVYLLFETNPSLLEFNPTILLLAAGLGGDSSR